METRETLAHIVKMGLASMLLALLVLVGGASVLSLNNQSLVQAQVAAQKPQVVPAVNTGTAPSTSNAIQGSGTQQAPGGVLDARTAVRHTEAAVVTVINHLQTQTGTGSTRVPGFGGPQQQPQLPQAPMASGSGVIVDKAGYIVTNNHVVEGAQSLEIIFYDGKKATAKLVGTDPYSDLAVLKVDGTMPGVATFGDSSKLEQGQPVVAIGSALGDYNNTVTAGIVSALHREIKDANEPSLRDLIQTDAAINHGNSGGPLLDLDGNIIGINVAVVRGSAMSSDVAEGLGFAIPSNTAREVSNQLIQNGAVSRPYIGISYQMINKQIAAYENLPRDTGVLVSGVEAGSPAEKAGIKANSIITKFDGVQLDETTSFLELLMKHQIGDSVKLTVLDEGQTTEHDVTVVLTNRPANK